MSSATYYVQECPSCGRQLQIRLEYLGRSVACKHCEREFEASHAARVSDSGEELLSRVDELLASVESSKPHPR